MNDELGNLIDAALNTSRPDIVDVGKPGYPPGEYAIVELFGHTTLVGRIAEVERFGTKMLAVCRYVSTFLRHTMQARQRLDMPAQRL